MRRRHENTRRVQDVLNSIWAQGSKFVLYLRNFDLSSISFRTGLGSGSGTAALREQMRASGMRDEAPLIEATVEGLRKTSPSDLGLSGTYTDVKFSAAFLAKTESFELQLLEAISPVPMLKIHNLDDLEFLLPAFVASDDWQQAVRSLLVHASLIIFRYRSATPGVGVELALLAELERTTSTILLLEEGTTPPHYQFLAKFEVGEDGKLPPDTLGSIKTLTANAKPIAPEGLPPTPRRFLVEGDLRRGFIAQADWSLLRAQASFGGMLTLPGDPEEIYAALDWGAFSFASAFMMDDEIRMAQAACEIGRLLLFISEPDESDVASFYLGYAVSQLPRNHPWFLRAVQGLCIALLDLAEKSAPGLEQAIALEAEHFGSDAGVSEHYLHWWIKARVQVSSSNEAAETAAHRKAVTAYRELRNRGEAAFFGDAFLISHLTWGVVAGLIEPDNLSNIGELEISRALIGAPLLSLLVAVLSGGADWGRLYAELKSPAALIEAQALQRALIQT
jgi:hypothetical protein